MSTGVAPHRPAPGVPVLLWLLLALLVQGCAGQPSPAPPPVEPGRVPVLPDHVPWPELEPLPPPRPAAPPIAVLLSADTAHYRQVADALGEGRWTRYVLDGENDREVLQRVRSGGHRQAIAIGQQALTLLAPSNLEVVYCQVFDAELDAVRPRRGVAPLPEFGVQLDAWRLRQPTLRHVGLITGPEYQEVADRLNEAAEPRAIAVHSAVVRSDKELLFVFRRMVPEIQGFVLYPDTSILSPAAIRELLTYARKHDVWVMTYNRAVFDLGAALLLSADPEEVARQALAALETRASGPVESPLSRVMVEASLTTGDGG